MRKPQLNERKTTTTMSNEKEQTALQILIEWGDNMMKEHHMKTLSFAEAIDKAEELLPVEEIQIQQAFVDGKQVSREYFINSQSSIKSSTQYYNTKYGKETDSNASTC
jgi:hypothetical protein